MPDAVGFGADWRYDRRDRPTGVASRARNEYRILDPQRERVEGVERGSGRTGSGGDRRDLWRDRWCFACHGLRAFHQDDTGVWRCGGGTPATEGVSADLDQGQQR